MIRLLFVGDGERDAATIPRIVEKILEVPIQEEVRKWARLHGRGNSPKAPGRGYGSKLAFALRVARGEPVQGLVATVDTDKSRPGERLSKLREARAQDRESQGTFPTALGEAVPHGEAWLLDDPVAVRESLGLSSETEVPTVRRAKNPKGILHDLLAASPRVEERPLVVWADIARVLEAKRCTHAKTTGFHGFVEDVQKELGQLAAGDQDAA